MQAFLRKPVLWVFVIVVLIIILISLLTPRNKDLKSDNGSSDKTTEVKSNAGSCLILEEKFCKTAKIIDNPNISGGKMAAFSLPAGTPIFSPSIGFFLANPTYSFKGTKEAYRGSSIAVGEKNTSRDIKKFYDFVYFSKENGFSGDKIKKGEILGYTSDKPIYTVGNYNLIFTITNQNIIENEAIFTPNKIELNSLFK